MERRTLRKNWDWPWTLDKIKSYFTITVLNKLFGSFYWLIICGFILIQRSLSLRLLQMVHFHVPTNLAASLLWFFQQYHSRLFCVIAVFLYYIYSVKRVLKTKRSERLSDGRKTFRITVRFSSNKMQNKSTSQIALSKM